MRALIIILSLLIAMPSTYAQTVACSESGAVPPSIDPSLPSKIISWVSGVEQKFGITAGNWRGLHAKAPTPEQANLIDIQALAAEWRSEVRQDSVDFMFRSAVAHGVNVQYETLMAKQDAAHASSHDSWAKIEAARASACLALTQQPGAPTATNNMSAQAPAAVAPDSRPSAPTARAAPAVSTGQVYANFLDRREHAKPHAITIGVTIVQVCVSVLRRVDRRVVAIIFDKRASRSPNEAVIDHLSRIPLTVPDPKTRLEQNTNRGNPAVSPSMYDFRIEDLEPDHVVLIQCACGHRSFLSRDELLRHPRIKPHVRILGLRFYVRCSLCRKRGRVDITVKRLAPF